MKQQIDLYQRHFRKETPPLAALTVFRLVAVVLAGLLLIYGLAQWGASVKAGRLGSLEKRLSAEERRIALLAETHPPAKKDPEIEAEVERLREERMAKTRLLRALSTEALVNGGGFSRHLAGLARQHLPGLWLREIQIHGGGRELDLAGSTLEPSLVPRFIQQLGQEAAFAGGEFHSLRLQRSEVDSGLIDFALSTKGEPQP
jgi:MSHA biogenesis protein MshI